MDDTKKKYLAAFISVSFGVLTCLEAFGVTNLGGLKSDTPRWLIGLIGTLFIMLGPMILLPLSRWVNDLFAFVIVASMGVVFAWISLFGDAGGFSGDAALVSQLTSFPLQRIMFGFGALFCFAGALVVLVSAVRS